MTEFNKAQNIIESLFFDEKQITQWQYNLLSDVVKVAKIKSESELNKLSIAASFNHEIIEKIRKSSTDAEARKIIDIHIKSINP